MKINNTTYKNTAIGLIPSDWEIKKLGSLGNIISGLTYSPDDISEEKGLLVLRSSNIQDRQLVFDDNVFVNVEADKFNPVKKDDILICVRNGSKSLIGKNTLITDNIEGVAFGAFMAVFRSDYNNYLFQVFGTYLYQREIHKNLGATINSINGSDLKEFKIPFPPLPEQQKIASILSIWDKAIDNCKGIIEELKIRNKGLTQKLFNKDFEKKHLSEIFERITTKNSENNQNVITISAQRGFIKQTDFFNKVIASTVLDNYTLVKKGDFCYNKSYSNGYDWGATKRLNDFEKAVVTTLYICFRLKDENQNSGDFFEYFFESGILNKGLSKVANEGGRAHGLLNVTSFDFFNIKIGVPTFEEQKAIAAILDKATQELKQYEQKLETLQLQKKGLMQQLLTGKVRVKI